MSDVWIAGTFTVIGAVIAGALAHLQARRDQRWRTEEREVAARERRADEVRARMDEKSDELVHLLRSLETRLFGTRIPLRRDVLMPADPAERREVRELLARVDMASSYLTLPLRRHVRVVVDLLPDAERLSGERWVDAYAWSIGSTAIHWARWQVERYIRGEKVANELGEPIGSYVEGWEDLQQMIEHQMEAEEHGPATDADTERDGDRPSASN